MKKEKKKILITPVAVATGIGAFFSQWLFLLAIPIAIIIGIFIMADQFSKSE